MSDASISDPAEAGGGAILDVVRGTWLSEELLLWVGSFNGAGHLDVEVSATVEGREVGGYARSLFYSPPGLQGQRSGGVVISRFPSRTNMNGQLALEVRSGDTITTLAPADLASSITDLDTLVRSDLATLDAKTRAEVLDFILTELTPELEREGAFALGEKLRHVRDVLREHLPGVLNHADQQQALAIEQVMAIDERSFFIVGWLRDIESPNTTSLIAVSPEGARVEILRNAYRYPRPDVAQFFRDAGVEPGENAGFSSFVRLPAPSLATGGWIFELRNGVGTALQTEGPGVVRDLPAVRSMLLGELGKEPLHQYPLTADHAHPALETLQRRLHDSLRITRVVQYGEPASSPEVSLVVPLYLRIHFLRDQLAQFVHDPEIRRGDLIYVLDSPELEAEFAPWALEQFRLYQVPFRIVTLDRNVGFAGATNAGCALARGRLLLLLNSDVIPEKPGWLSKMRSFYDATPRVGALGPKMLYEDESLQHAGMYFHRQAGSPLWENHHYFKGLHRELPDANITRRVPAVTGACLMVERELYEEVGGLRTGFVQGGFEDSDLCLRLVETGRENWYLHEAELYHLEDQSFPSEIRLMTVKYNMWLHTRIWDERIKKLMSNDAFRPGVIGPNARNRS